MAVQLHKEKCCSGCERTCQKNGTDQCKNQHTGRCSLTPRQPQRMGKGFPPALAAWKEALLQGSVPTAPIPISPRLVQVLRRTTAGFGYLSSLSFPFFFFSGASKRLCRESCLTMRSRYDRLLPWRIAFGLFRLFATTSYRQRLFVKQTVE